MTASLTLYSAKNTCALAVQIALLEADAPHNLVWIDFGAQEQRGPDYLAINPKGRVPALATEHGVLTEAPALLFYVAQRFAAAQLAPLNNPFELARMQELMSYLASTVHVSHAHGRRGPRWADEASSHADMQRKMPQNMIDGFTVIEQHYLQGPWVLGDVYSVADAYLFTVASWLKGDGVDIAQFPKVHAHTQRMLQRPAVQKALG